MAQCLENDVNEPLNNSDDRSPSTQSQSQAKDNYLPPLLDTDNDGNDNACSRTDSSPLSPLHEPFCNQTSVHAIFNDNNLSDMSATDIIGGIDADLPLVDEIDENLDATYSTGPIDTIDDDSDETEDAKSESKENSSDKDKESSVKIEFTAKGVKIISEKESFL